MSVKKKVLFVSVLNSFMTQFLLPYLKLFHDKGYEVHVVTGESGKIPFCDRKHTISLKRSPLDLNNLKAIKELSYILKEEHFDIIHCHTPMGGVVTRMAVKRTKTYSRVIYTAHGFHFFKGAPLYYWLFFYPVEKYLAKYTDTLITINLEDYSIAQKKLKRCKDIHYIPGVGLNTEKFQKQLTTSAKIKKRRELGLSENDFVMIFPAEISKNKRQKWLISTLANLMAEHNNIHLLLPGLDRTNGACARYAKKLGLEKQVHFLGYRKDVPELLQISNLSVSSSRREGLPVNIMEAMYSGLPVVLSDCRGNRDLIKDDNGGRVIPANNKEAFAAAIKLLHANPETRKKFGKFNAKEIKKYELASVIDSYQKVYFRKRKILHLLSSNKFSGAENVACTIIEGLKNNYELSYCSPNGEIKSSLAKNNIAYLPLKNFTHQNLKKVIKNFNPSVIHAHDLRACFLATTFQSRKIKVIFHIHKNDPKMRKISPKSILYHIFEKKCFKTIWVSSSALKDYKFNSPQSSTKNLVLQNTINARKIQTLAKAYSSKNFDIIFLGRLEDQKDPLRFLDIISQLTKINPNLKVAIVGDGNLMKSVRAKIKKLNLTQIQLFGFIENPYPILAHSKILLMTSKFEGQPISILEATSLGVTCIVTAATDIKESRANKVYVCNDNNSIIKTTIKQLKSAGQNSTPNDNTSYDTYIATIKHLYEEVE